jgi:beta-galactosidase
VLPDLGALRARPQGTDRSGWVGLAGDLPCGDLDITGHRRPASYYREIVFGLRSEPYIAVQRPNRYGQEVAVAPAWAWTDSVSSWTWRGREGEPVIVEVYSDADEIQLSLNGTVVGRESVGKARPYCAEFALDYRPGQLTATAYRDGTATGTATLTSAASDVVINARADRTDLRADTSDLAFVTLELTDGSGVLHTDRDQAVSVTVAGAGALAALGSANPSTEETFSAAAHHTFDGRALAIIRPTSLGPIEVTASDRTCS